MLGARKERSADACRDGARARFVAVRRLCSLPKQAELSWKESSLISARRCNLAIGAAFVLRSTTRWPTIHEKQAVRLLFNKEHDAAPATTFPSDQDSTAQLKAQLEAQQREIAALKAAAAAK